MTPEQRRDRCEKLYADVHAQKMFGAFMDISAIEAFAIEIRNEALEEIASYFSMTHPNDETAIGGLIYTKQAAQYIRALKSEGRE